MLLSIYQAGSWRYSCGFGAEREQVESQFEIVEVDSVEEAVERCVRRVADDDDYSLPPGRPDGDFAFVLIRAASAAELAGCGEPIESCANVGAGELCGRLAKFDLAHAVAERVRAIRLEVERQRRAAAEAAAQLRRELEAERQKRERRALFEQLKREFESGGEAKLSGES